MKKGSEFMKKSIKYLGVYLFIIFILPLILGVVGLDKNTGLMNTINVVAFLFMSILAFVLFKGEILDSLSDIKKKPFKVILIAVVAVIIILVLSSIVVKLSGTTKVTGNQSDIGKFVNTGILSVITIVVLGPFVEEVVFRYVIIGEFSKKYNIVLMSIISIITFSLVHVKTLSIPGILESFSYAVPSIVITTVYLMKQKKMAYTVVLHMLNNLVTVLVLLVAKGA